VALTADPRMSFPGTDVRGAIARRYRRTRRSVRTNVEDRSAWNFAIWWSNAGPTVP
jgi:hypothetical protein